MGSTLKKCIISNIYRCIIFLIMQALRFWGTIITLKKNRLPTRTIQEKISILQGDWRVMLNSLSEREVVRLLLVTYPVSRETHPLQ